MFSALNPYVTYIKLAAFAIGALALLSGGAYAGYRWELGKYEQLVTADAKAMTAAVEKARDQERKIASGNQEDAVAQAYFKGKMDAATVNLVLGVPANVTISQDVSAAAADRAGCVTYGFLRVLIAGERGEPAESFSIPSGESVDSCTALEPSILAAALAQDLAAGTFDAHQLDSLIAAVKRNNAILEGELRQIPLPSLAEIAPLHAVVADVGQPNDVDAGDRQPGPPSQREAHNSVKPEVKDTPGTIKRGWEPVDAGEGLTAADRPYVQDGEAGRAQLKGSLGFVRVNLHLVAPDI